jgi:hypothetical protein
VALRQPPLGPPNVTNFITICGAPGSRAMPTISSLDSAAANSNPATEALSCPPLLLFLHRLAFLVVRVARLFRETRLLFGRIQDFFWHATLRERER